MFVLLLCMYVYCFLFNIPIIVLQQYEERLREMAAQKVSITDYTYINDTIDTDTITVFIIYCSNNTFYKLKLNFT